VDLLPVVLESKTGRELKAYSPVFIHNCLEKFIGSVKGCVEFALHPQHETSRDPEKQTKEDFKSKLGVCR